MAINFPSSPVTGDVYSYSGTPYQWDGTHWIKMGGVGQILDIQVFTASGTYTPTTGMEMCIIECVGSGGGGGGVATSSGLGCAGGGGGGSYARTLATAAAVGASQTVTVGNAGNGGAAGNNPGTAGSDVSVGSLCIGKGGSAGGGAAGNSTGIQGAGGVAGTGDFTIPGQPGDPGGQSGGATVWNPMGRGGDAGLAFGLGGRATTSSNTGATGGVYGGGGAAGGDYNSLGAKGGGGGGKGVAIITEYARSSPLPGVASSTDNAIVRFDGTAGRCQNSSATLDDTGGMLVPGATQFSNQITVGYVSGSLGGTFLPLAANYGKPTVQGVTSGFAPEQLYINPVGGQISFGGDISANTGRIIFPATQNPSASANVLDDYEEGTWTVSYTSTGSTFNYALREGLYTKVGNMVFIKAYIQLAGSGNTLSVNALGAGTVPFTNISVYAAPMFTMWNQANNSPGVLSSWVLGSGTSIGFGSTAASGLSSVASPGASTLLHSTAGTTLWFEGCYTV